MTRAENAPSHLCSPAQFRVELINPSEQPDWDKWIAGFSEAGIFHSAAWASVLRDTYGFVPLYFKSAGGDRSSALLPVMEVRSWLTGKRGVSLPFTDHCRPCGDSESLRRIIEEAARRGLERGWKHIEYRGGAGLFGDAEPSLSFFGHKLNLAPGARELFGNLSSSARRAVRKARKSGLEIEISRSVAATKEYYSLHCKTRKKHGLPPQPLKFFLNIQKHVLSTDKGMIVSARSKGRAIASAMFFYFGPEAVYKFGASDPAFQESRANNLVMWEAIQWLAQRGAKVLDFGRTSLSNEGLRRYKLGWGAEEFPLHYFKFDLRRNAFVTDKDNSSGWHTLFFRAMPAWLARFAGNLLYRHTA